MRDSGHVDVEATLLSGGSSTRMGSDKSRLPVDGRPLVEVLASRIHDAGISVTVLGGIAVQGHGHSPDRVPGSGPAAALLAFAPKLAFVFALSCDIPRFDANVIPLLRSSIGEADCAIPEVEGRLQFLCALYRSEALRREEIRGCRSFRSLTEQLTIETVREQDLLDAGVEPKSILGANTPEQWRELVDG